MLYGKLLAFGTAEEVIERANITTWSVSGPGLAGLSRETSHPARRATGGRYLARALHVSGDDADALEKGPRLLSHD